MWIARDKNGSILLYKVKPCKSSFRWQVPSGTYTQVDPLYYSLDPSFFWPEVQWQDEQPRKVKLVLEEDNE